MRALALLLLVLPACDDFGVFSAIASRPDVGETADLATHSDDGGGGGGDLATLRWELQASGTNQDLNAVWGSGPDDVWAVGASGWVLRRQAGGAWMPVSTGAKETLWTVWGSGGDVWMAGDAGQVVRVGAPSVVTTTKEGRRLYSGSSGLLVGVASSVYRLMGQTWKFDPYVGATDFYGVWSGGAEGWMVGTGGLIVHVTASMLPEGSSNNSLTLRAVWSDGKGAAIAVGDGGTIVRRGGGGVWTSVVNADLHDLRAVHGIGTMRLWAVGGGGTITESKDGGLTWKTQVNTVTSQLNGVWASAADDVYVVGAGGVILHYGR